MSLKPIWRQALKSSSRAEFWELIPQRGTPLTRQPLSRVGVSGADARDF